jgi:hypothetical protein
MTPHTFKNIPRIIRVYTLRQKCFKNARESRIKTKIHEMTSVIAFDDILAGGSVRFTVIGGEQYLSVRDVIMVVSNKKQREACDTWADLPISRKNELSDYSRQFTFSGRGQVPQTVITCKGALLLILILPGEKVKDLRSKFADVLIRYFAGDETLVAEIRANAQSDAPVCEMARAALGDDETLKRKREVEDIDLEERRLALEEKKLELQKRKDMQHIDNMAYILGMRKWEARDEISFTSHMSNFVELYVRNATGGSQKQIGNGSQGNGKYTSIPCVVNRMGVKITAGAPGFQRIGLIASNKFLAKHGVRPKEMYGKHKERTADGVQVEANDYLVTDEPLLMEAVNEYLAEVAAKNGPPVVYPRVDYRNLASLNASGGGNP